VTEPVPTITSGAGAKRPAGAAHALGVAAPVMVQAAHGEGRPGGVKRWRAGSKHVREPVGTVTASGSGGQAVACAFVEQANEGFTKAPAAMHNLGSAPSPPATASSASRPHIC